MLVTYLLDLIAYCNLALFMMNSTFNPICADDESVNEYVYACVYVVFFLLLLIIQSYILTQSLTLVI